MTTVLKLGGSLITRKAKADTIDEEQLETAAAAIGESTVEDLIVVHGGGSFGHVHADAHGVTIDTGTRDPAVVREIHAAMGRLNRRVLDALDAYDVPAVPVRPFSAGYRPALGSVWLATDHVEAMLAEDFVPVLHGDVFATAGEGATIVSGDELVVALARTLGTDAVGLCASVPGVLDDEGAVIPEIDSFAEVADSLDGATTTDVTGGMAGKVRALLDLAAPARIFDLDGLPAFLEGGEPGTLVRGRQ